MNLLIYRIENVRKFVFEKLRVNLSCRQIMSVNFAPQEVGASGAGRKTNALY